MFNRSASLAMSTSVLKALPGKLDIKRHSPSILYTLASGIYKVDLYTVMQVWTLPVNAPSGTYDLGDNCIQNFHLGRYIVGYMVGKLVLRQRVSGAVKRDFRTYIRRYTSPNENFEYGYPYSNALLTFPFKKTVKMYFFAPIRPATLAA